MRATERDTMPSATRLRDKAHVAGQDNHGVRHPAGVRLALAAAGRAVDRVQLGAHLVPGLLELALNMFCQYIYQWMYAVPAADL